MKDDQKTGEEIIVEVAQLQRQLAQRGAVDRQSRAELQAIYDGMVDGLVLSDIETRCCLRANRSMCEMLGYTEEELKSIPPEALHPPELLPTLMEKFAAIVQGRASRAEDIPFVRKDGSLIYVDVKSNWITYHGRRCLISFFRDTTQRRQAQEALQREHSTLKHLLQSSDHERQLIAYEIHDGLAQQLAGAIMQFQVYDQLKSQAPEEAMKAHAGGVTLVRQGHLEARRLIAGVRSPVLDESGVVEAIAHLIHERCCEKGPKIEFKSRVEFGRLVPILENAIYRIIQEGLSNACKHSNSKIVRIGLTQLGEQVRVEIRDWGIGFEPKRVKDGCYGLAGIRARARLLGGKCSVRSTPGKGTRIAVELPVVLKE